MFIFLEIIHLFGCGHHTIFHKSSFESPVHSFQAVGISETFHVCLGFENPSSRVLNSLVDSMAPCVDGFFHPVCCSHFVHRPSLVNEFLVSLLGNEVRVGPFFVQVLQISFITLLQWNFSIVTLAPGGHHKLAARLQHSHHLLNIFLLVGHMLSTFTGPNNVKGVVREAHGQGIFDPKVSVWSFLLNSEFSGTLHLLGAQSNRCHFSVWSQCARQISGGSSKAATDIQPLPCYLPWG